MTSNPQLKDYIKRRLLLKTAVIDFVSPIPCFCACNSCSLCTHVQRECPMTATICKALCSV